VSTLQLTIDADSATAPFEQVRTQIATAVATGRLCAGTKLPTVRRLAADLGLAANTVARAYRELEADAVVSTQGRRGTFVRSEVLDELTDHSSTADIVRESAVGYVHTARRLGLNSQEAVRLIENTWSEDEHRSTTKVADTPAEEVTGQATSIEPEVSPDIDM
jgi:DNA-binding transcriptional regulator YhcF (GntR family)